MWVGYADPNEYVQRRIDRDIGGMRAKAPNVDWVRPKAVTQQDNVRALCHDEVEFIPFPERVNANFKAWVEAASRRLIDTKRQDAASTGFTPEQLRWLETIRDHIAANLRIAPDDFEYAPFSQQGGLGRVHQLFGDRLDTIIEELNETLAAWVQL